MKEEYIFTKHFQQSNQTEWKIQTEILRKEFESLKDQTQKSVQSITDRMYETLHGRSSAHFQPSYSNFGEKSTKFQESTKDIGLDAEENDKMKIEFEKIKSELSELSKKFLEMNTVVNQLKTRYNDLSVVSTNVFIVEVKKQQNLAKTLIK